MEAWGDIFSGLIASGLKFSVLALTFLFAPQARLKSLKALVLFHFVLSVYLSLSRSATF